MKVRPGTLVAFRGVRQAQNDKGPRIAPRAPFASGRSLVDQVLPASLQLPAKAQPTALTADTDGADWYSIM